MLTKWFESRTSDALKDRSFRPWLESLEERNAPGGGGGPDHDHGPPDHDHGPPPPPPGPVNNGVQSSVNASAGNGNHGSFNNSTITGSFNNTVTTTINNMVTVNLGPAQALGVERLFAIGGFLNSMNSQLGTLVADEIALAVDQYLSTAVPSTASALSSDITTLTNAINGITATSPFAGFIGHIAYDATTDALTAAAAP